MWAEIKRETAVSGCAIHRTAVFHKTQPRGQHKTGCHLEAITVNTVMNSLTPVSQLQDMHWVLDVAKSDLQAVGPVSV